MSFDVWLESHQARFPKLVAYFESDVTIVRDWQKVLGGFEFADLTNATLEMMQFGRTVWESDQLGTVLRLVKRIKKDREFVEAAPPDTFHTSYACLECRDTAMIRVIAVDPKRFSTFEAMDKTTLVDCNTSCTCSQGEKLRKTREGKRPGPLPVYVEGRCWRYDYEFEWPENVSKALDFLKSLEVSKRHSEFDVFQESGYGTGQDF